MENSQDEFFAQELEKLNDKVTKALRSTLRPEFLNRLDKIVLFYSLTRRHIERTTEAEIGKTQARLAKKGTQLQVTPTGIEVLVDRSYSPMFGHGMYAGRCKIM